MPVINNNNQQQNNQSQQSQTSQNQAQGPQAPGPKQRGTGFTNIQRMLGASDRGRVSSAIGQGIQGQVGRVQQGLQSAQNQFQQGVAQGRLDTNANKQYVTNTLQQAVADPTIVSGDTNEAKAIRGRFDTFRQGQYTGPTELAQAGQLQAQAQDTSNLAALTRTAGGRNALVSRFLGNQPGYSSGMARFDTMLAQTNAAPIRQARQQAAGLGGQVNAASQQAISEAEAARAASKQFATDTLNQIAGTRGGIEGTTPALESQVKDLDTANVVGKYIWGHSSNDAAPIEVRESARSVYTPVDYNIAGLQDQLSKITGNTVADRYNRARLQEDINKAKFQSVERLLSGGVTRSEIGQFDPTLQSTDSTLEYNPLVGNELAIRQLRDQNLISDQDYAQLSGGLTSTHAGLYGNVPFAKSYVGQDLKNVAANEGGRGGNYARQLIQLTNDNPYLLPDAPRLLASQQMSSGLQSGLDYTTGQNLSMEGLATAQERAQLNALSALAGQTAKYNTAGANYQQGGLKFNKVGDLLSKFEQAKQQYLDNSKKEISTI